ncbi:unnamed protein product [Sympodiomycopsis kandeliae]
MRSGRSIDDCIVSYAVATIVCEFQFRSKAFKCKTQSATETSRYDTMLVVGLTGGIASGKSTVSRLLTQKHGVALIDLDILARQVVAPNDSSQTLSKLAAHFGTDILNVDGTLDRGALGRLCFGPGKESQKKVLNKITHSAIRKRMMWILFHNWITGTKITVVDTPLLIEGGLWKYCGETVIVWCSPEDQLVRMLARDGESQGLTEEDARSRLSSQDSLQSKLPYADIILDNSSALSSGDRSSSSQVLEAQVADMVRKWNRQYSGLIGNLYWLATWIFPPFAVTVALLCLATRRIKIGKKLKEADRSDTQSIHRRSFGSQ